MATADGRLVVNRSEIRPVTIRLLKQGVAGRCLRIPDTISGDRDTA